MGPSRTLGGEGRRERAGHNGDGAARERVVEIQRTRMLTAMAEVACERGAANVTVAHVVERARVSRRTFYEVFEDVEDCFLEALEDAVHRVAVPVRSAYEAGGPWLARIRAALLALLELLDAEPSVGRLLVVQAPGAGAKALKRRQEVLRRLVAAVDDGRSAAKSGAQPPPMAAEGAVGAVLSILHARMIDDGAGSLVGLVNPLMSIIVLPYLGAAASRRELERPVSRVARRSPRKSGGNPLEGLEIRLTYRTVCVLCAVADSPGSSNKCVADASGISDQGQISKLLARLEKLGLVENAGPATMRGEPNAWTLTEAGQHVHASVVHASP